jgi:hypothetical protein
MLDTTKALFNHASKDQTRYRLCGVYFDGEKLVATDGHRLIAVDAHKSHIPIGQLKPGTIMEVKAWKVGGINLIDGQYPPWKELVCKPDDADKITLTLPSWLADVKRSKGLLTPIGITKDGHLSTNPKAVKAWFNPHYLGAYAREEVNVYIKDNTAPMYIEPVNKQDWFAVLMPVVRN